MGDRKSAEAIVLSVMGILDATGANKARWKSHFQGMTDTQFIRWSRDFLEDPDSYFDLEVQPLGGEPGLGEIRKAAKIVNVPLEEHVWVSHGGSRVRTPGPVPCGYLYLKRLQQLLAKKNSYSLDIDKRDMITNQVTGEDRVARVSDTENFALTAMGADNALREFLGPRADSRTKKRQMYGAIYSNGYCQLKDMTSQPDDSQALAATDVFFLGAGIKTDLITGGLALPRTLRNLNRMGV
jgi:hypothetical protein